MKRRYSKEVVLESRKWASFDNLRSCDVVFINLGKGELFYLGNPEGHLKFEIFFEPDQAYRFFFFRKTKKEIEAFLREKAESANPVKFKIIFICDKKDILEISFLKR